MWNKCFWWETIGVFHYNEEEEEEEEEEQEVEEEEGELSTHLYKYTANVAL